MAIPDDPFAPSPTRQPISPTPNPSSSRPKIFHIGPSPPSPILAPSNRTPPNLPRLDTGTPSLLVTDTNAIAGPSGTSNSNSGIHLSGLGGSGAKTPRRVQWTNESHVVSISPPGSPVDTLDDRNFEQVRTALERHSTQRRAARRALSRQNAEPDDEEDITAVDDHGEEDYDYRLDVGSGSEGHRDRLHRTMSNLSSGASSLMGIGEESEDEEDEHRHPALAAMSEAIRRGSIKMGLTNAQLTTGNDGAVEPQNGSDPASAAQGQQIQGMMGGADAQITAEQSEIHAQMAVYVDPGETDGMPSLPMPPAGAGDPDRAGVATSDWAENHAEASALINAHRTGKFGAFLRNRKNGFKSGLGLSGPSTETAPPAVSRKPSDPEKGSAKAERDNMAAAVASQADGANPSSKRPSASRGSSRRSPGTPLAFVAGAGHAIGSTATKLGSSAGHAASKFGGHLGQGFGGSKFGGTFGTGSMAGASVLSSLMALNAAEAMPASGATTPAGSRPASMMSELHTSEEERWEKEQRRRERKDKEKMRLEQKESQKRMQEAARQAARAAQTARGERPGFLTRPRSRLSDTGSSPASPTEGVDPNFLPVPNAPLSSGSRSRSQSSLPDYGKRVYSAPMKGLKSMADRIGVDLNEFERPKAARSAGGVFAALAQSTGNISGAATPSGSTLVPAAKRPGYRLSRYSLDGQSHPVRETPERPASLLVQSESRRLSGENDASNSGSPSSGHTKVDAPDPLVSPAVAARNRRAPPTSIEMPPTYNKTGTGRQGKAFSMKDFKMGPLTPGAASFKQASNWVMGSGGKSQPNTPPSEYGGEKGSGGDYFFEKASRKLTEDDWRRREWEAEKKKRRKAKEKKKQQEIYIIQHVAALLARQQFILKLTRAFMMFGSPSHRLEAQIQATARVLELNCQVVYFPGTALISFGDEATHTSETKFMKQATGLDLGKLLKTHYLYWNVVHDKISAEQASTELDALMLSKAHYNNWTMLLIGGMCSAFICCIAFYGSFIDALISIPLGVLLIAVQILAARNDLYSNIFEIIIATINSFLAAALASTGKFCYTAVASSAIVLILPGYIVLTGALELASRNITAGATRIAYSVIYSLFLGFGLSMGGTIYERITGLDVVGAEDYTCASTHYDGAPWYMTTPSAWWYFLIAPGYSFFLALRQSQPLWAKETPVMVLFSCAGWATNHFSAVAFPNRSDITSMFGSLVVGVLGNLWGRFFQGNSFVVMLVGILFQLPSGLSNGGLFNFASENNDGTTDSYGSGFEVAEQLVSVAIGLTVGLFLAAVVVYPFGAGKKRGAGIFSF